MYRRQFIKRSLFALALVGIAIPIPEKHLDPVCIDFTDIESVEEFSEYFKGELSPALKTLFIKVRAHGKFTRQTQYEYKVELCKWMLKDGTGMFKDEIYDLVKTNAKKFLRIA